MSELQQGLVIAAIGMGLVFAIIIFLWGLMALMMRLTSREKNEVAAQTHLRIWMLVFHRRLHRQRNPIGPSRLPWQLD